MKRLLVCLLSVFALTTNAFAQDPTSQLPKAAPVITAASVGGGVRFSSEAGVCQIRVQVLGQDGIPLIDSAWKDGDVLDWVAETAGEPLTSGTYRCIVMVKDLDGRTTQREALLNADGGQVALQSAGGEHSLAIINGREPSPKITVLAHDGANGSIVSTGGDLSFRFGNFLAGQDSEKMRLTAEGRLGIGTEKPEAALDVAGYIRSTKGILFEDGTVLTSINGQLTTESNKDHVGNGARASTPLNLQPALPLNARLTPRSSTVGTPRFITTDTGVGIWNATPAFKLDVGGDVNASYYRLGGDVMLNSYFDNVFVGPRVGTSTSGQTNTFVGSDSGSSNTTGSNNVFVGKGSGYHNTTGMDNVAVGIGAGTANASGGSNVFVGSQTGINSSTAYGNTFLGASSGGSTTTEWQNTTIGTQADLSPGVTNATAVGARAKATQSNTVILGSIWGVNGATSTCYTGIGTQTPNQQLGIGGGITIDQNGSNIGTVAPNTVIAFGTAAGNGLSGEAIGSQRAGTGSLYGLDFYTYFQKRMTITQLGRIGIGVDNPTYADLELVVGKVGIATAWYTWSSAAFKENIRPIDSALEKTRRLRGVAFDYKDGGAHSVGFIAEDVAQVVPEAVLRDGGGNPVGVDYGRITPLLVEALKAQEKTIHALEERIQKLEAAQKDSPR